MSALKLFAAPASEPLTLSDTKNFLKVEHTTDDSLITMLISGARIAAEGITNRALITQTWDFYIDQFPPWEQYIPFPSLQSITSIKYYDTDGALQTLASNQYRADLVSEPARVEPAFGLIWPITRWQSNAVVIRFVCGYGAAADVPAGILNWMLMRIRTMYDNRAQIEIGQGFTVLELPNEYVDGLLNDYRVDCFDWAKE